MPKRSKKSKASKPQPDASQFKAIERLLVNQDGEKAVQRLKSLMQRFPDDSRLNRLLVDALELSEGAHAAALAAFEWAERKPGSVQAQQVLLSLASRCGHIALADRVARHLRGLGYATRGFPVASDVLAGLGSMPDGALASIEEVEQFDIGKLYLDAQDFAGAIRRLDGVNIFSARNNRALALFHVGRIDEALSSFLASWEANADNLFALGWAARLRLYGGDEPGAQGLTAPLAAATARRRDDALMQLDALLLLGNAGAAWDAYQRYARSDQFQIGEGIPGAILEHFAACAASRLGKTAEARRLWRDALRIAPAFKLAQDNIACLDRDGQTLAYPMVFDFSRAFPIGWLNALRAAKDVDEDMIDSLTAAIPFIEAMYLNGDEGLRSLAGLFLSQRVRRGDPDAARLLRGFACLPIGTKDERFGCLRLLQEQDLIARDERVDYWDGTRVQQIFLINTEIHREREDVDLPDDLQALLEESMSLWHEADYAGAESGLLHILERIPNHAVAKGNLAAVRSAQGRHGEAQQLLRQTVAEHPDYLCARCNLANLLTLEDQLDEADELLNGLATRERIHAHDMFVLYGAMALLSRARGEQEVADSLLASLEQIVENDDDARQLEFAKNLQKSIAPRPLFLKALSAWAQSAKESTKRRDR